MKPWMWLLLGLFIGLCFTRAVNYHILSYEFWMVAEYQLKQMTMIAFFGSGTVLVIRALRAGEK